MVLHTYKKYIYIYIWNMIRDMGTLIILIIMNVLIVVYLHVRKPSGIKVTIMQHFI